MVTNIKLISTLTKKVMIFKAEFDYEYEQYENFQAVNNMSL